MLEKIGIAALICYVGMSIIAFVLANLWRRERNRRVNAEREIADLKETVASEKQRTRELKIVVIYGWAGGKKHKANSIKQKCHNWQRFFE